MNNRYLLIVDDFLPHSTKVGAKMMHDLAITLQNKGKKVTVLTPSPFLKKSFERKNIQGVDVLFFKSGKTKNISKIKRGLNETLLSYKAWKNTKHFFDENVFDNIIYYSPSIFWGPLVGWLKKKYNAKTYLILRDIFPQWTVDNGLIKENSIIHKYFAFFEKITYKYADRIGVMSNANLKFCQSKYKNAEKFEILPNWTKIKPQKEKQIKYRKELKLEDKVIFFYGGNIGHAQSMEKLINLAIHMKPHNNAHFLFVGNGDEVELIMSKKKQHNLNNVTYLPPVDQEQYFQMLSEIDVGLFNLHPKHQTHNFPGKLLGYMEYSKPILGCVNKGNDLKKIINNANAGFVFENGEEEDFVKKAIELLNSQEYRKQIGENGLKLLHEKFDVENIANILC